jgi:hypothetical protein
MSTFRETNQGSNTKRRKSTMPKVKITLKNLQEGISIGLKAINQQDKLELNDISNDESVSVAITETDESE